MYQQMSLGFTPQQTFVHTCGEKTYTFEEGRHYPLLLTPRLDIEKLKGYLKSKGHLVQSEQNGTYLTRLLVELDGVEKSKSKLVRGLNKIKKRLRSILKSPYFLVPVGVAGALI